MLSCEKHIPYNEKINITHLFEEEMSTEKKWKKKKKEVTKHEMTKWISKTQCHGG